MAISPGCCCSARSAYALYAIWAQNRRGVRPSQARRSIAGDIGAVVVGLVAYALLVKYHSSLFGVDVWY
jgi:hypothetical protein